jgi:hypothetical protein
MQDNGIGPGEKNSLISDALCSGTVICVAQDRMNCQRVAPKQQKLRTELNATEKTGHKA